MEQVAFESFGGVIQASIDNKIIGTPLSNGVFHGEQKVWTPPPPFH